MFDKKTILITGGTGSFGKAFLSKLVKKKFGEIRIFSRDEKKQEDLRREFNQSNIKTYLGDVRDIKSVDDATKNVDFIFHAAALKQVPSCEFYPLEAVKTNILGTENILNSGVNNNVKKIIVLSTDKAVYPINAMGMTKGLAEKVAISKSWKQKNNKTLISCTRYGNVMYSRGSVIPLFIKQIQDKKPLTVTNGKMTRFLMSLDESVDLVFEAFKKAKQGEIFVQKSSSCYISDLAEAINIIYGRHKNFIKNIGVRHGEKVYETLISSEEMALTKSYGKYFIIKPPSMELNYEKYISKGNKLDELEEYNSNNTNILSKEDLLKFFESKNKMLEQYSQETY